MKNIILYTTTVCLVFLMSCGKDDVRVDSVGKFGLQKIGEQMQGDTRIVVWGDKSIETGYEKLFFQFLDRKSTPISDGKVTLIPTMEMHMTGESMSHSAPADPVVLGSDDLFEGGVVFTMPSDGEHGKWTLTVDYITPDKNLKSFIIPVQVKISAKTNVKTVSLESGDRYILSFYLSEQPKIGVNEVNFTLHKHASMTSFPAFKNATIKVDPRMPDMDNHGSPNNVNPLHKQHGHYTGRLNYTMSGYWIVNLEMMIDGEKVLTSFDQTF